MIRVKNRHVSAIGGWQFYEAALGKNYMNWDFGTICMEIQAGRKGNPRFKLNTSMASIENEVDERNALRMQKIQGGDTYIITDGDLSPKMSPLSPFQGLRAAVAGASTIVEWIASGAEAVKPILANHRAQVCTLCPLNDQGDWTAHFTEPVSNAIRKALSQRSEWKLATAFDAKLGVCSACLCPLPLKVHVPIQNILKRIPKDSFDRLHEACWIRAEQQNKL